MGLTQINNKIKIKIKNKRKEKEKDGRGTDSRLVLFFIFIIIFIFSRFSLRFTEIGPSEFVGGRSKVLYSMRATRKNQKHGILPSF